MQASSLIYGMRCGFYSGNMLQILNDIEKLKPTIFPSVPSFFNRMHGRISKKFSDEKGIKGKIINHAIKRKLYNLRLGRGFNHWLYDRIIFNKTKEILGNNTRMLISGSAPINREIVDYLKICFLTDLVNGYGMTEGCGASISTRAYDF